MAARRLLLIGTAVLVGATLIARGATGDEYAWLDLAVGSPYVAVAAAIVCAAALWRRRSVLAIGTAALVAVALALQVSWYYLERPSDVGPHAEVRVMAANINRGQADASSFVEIAEQSADVITVAELTPEAVARFAKFGINDVFRHSHLIPAPDAGGIVALSQSRQHGTIATTIWPTFHRRFWPGLRPSSTGGEPALAGGHSQSAGSPGSLSALRNQRPSRRPSSFSRNKSTKSR